MKIIAGKQAWIRPQSLQQGKCLEVREAFKYYFADFVRKWGTPPPFRQKKELQIFPRKTFFKKGKKLCFCSKNT